MLVMEKPYICGKNRLLEISEYAGLVDKNRFGYISRKFGSM